MIIKTDNITVSNNIDADKLSDKIESIGLGELIVENRNGKLYINNPKTDHQFVCVIFDWAATVIDSAWYDTVLVGVYDGIDFEQRFAKAIVNEMV